MFTEALEVILRDHCTPAAVRAIEDGGDPTSLWDTIAESGFLELLVPEAAGGAGLTPEEFFPVLLVLGRYATPLPLAQSMVARALLPEGACPPGMVAIAPGIRREPDGWLCPQVPFGAIAMHLLADDGESLLLFDCAGETRLPSGVAHSQAAGLCLHGEPRRFARPAADALRAWGAALQAALLAGGMVRAFEMTLQYGNERTQFGKSIGKFQAVQHQLAVMAEQVAASRLAAQAAFGGAAAAPGLLQAAMAKARTSEAVVAVAAIAHAVHGAIGVTAEYDLQLITRRLHEGRMAHGSEAHWHPLVGRALTNSGLPVLDFVRSLAMG